LKKLSIFVIFFFLAVLLCFNALFCQELKKELLPIKNVLIIEKNLFELVNKEREKHNFPLLRLSPDLSHLARQHSQDMASLQKLSHLSSSGKSYEERLVEAEFYYISTGENVAFSETFVAEFIHKPLMESSEHRKNILESAFDQVGIGAIYVDNKGYYITQDFLQSLEIKEEEAAKTEIQKKINDLRRESSLPPLDFLKEANTYARKYSQKKAEEKLPPSSPYHFGENQIIHISSPSLDEAESVYQNKILERTYEKAGLGVCFNRNKKYPGGSYFITLILFPENRYKYMKKGDLRNIILLNLNEFRQEKGLAKLRLDNALTDTAERILKKIMIGQTRLSLSPASMEQVAFWSYTTVDPTLLPKTLEDKMEKDFVSYVNIGIGITFKKNNEFPRGAFWVAIFLER